VFLHPSSVLSGVTCIPSGLLFFHENVKTTKLYLRDVTAIHPFLCLLFGGIIDILHEQQLVCLDGWLWVRLQTKVRRIALDGTPVPFIPTCCMNRSLSLFASCAQNWMHCLLAKSKIHRLTS